MKTQNTDQPGAVRGTALGPTALAAWLTLVACLPATAQRRYEVTDLGTLPGLVDSYVWQQTINNRGHVAAYANTAANPDAYAGDVSFLWKGPNEIEILPGLTGATDNIVMSINDEDQAVGDSGAVVLSDAHAVLWQQGAANDLGTLPGDTGSDAFLINNEGVVVGDSYNINTSIYHAVFWQRASSGGMSIVPLSPPNNAAVSYTTGINDRGQIVGAAGPDLNHVVAVLWTVHRDRTLATAFGTLGGDSSLAFAINNQGEIAGQAQIPSGDWHSTRWQDGQITDLGNFGTDPLGVAYAINNLGQIVGFSGQGFNDIATAHALLWQNGSMINLQTKIAANSSWVLQQAEAINDRGQITGIGLHNGQIRAFLLTPSEGEPD